MSICDFRTSSMIHLKFNNIAGDPFRPRSRLSKIIHVSE
jgi:hypothetical protein